MDDQLLSVLQQAQSDRNSIWMFYTIIVTTAFGIAFTDNYRKLDTWVKVMISIGTGAAAWYNFAAMYHNAQLINDIVYLIQTTSDPQNPVVGLFKDSTRFGGAKSLIGIHIVYGFVNIALFVALWWSETHQHIKRLYQKTA